MSCSEHIVQTGESNHCQHSRDGHYNDWVCCWCGDLFVDVEDGHGEYTPKRAGQAIKDVSDFIDGVKDAPNSKKMWSRAYVIRMLDTLLKLLKAKYE